MMINLYFVNRYEIWIPTCGCEDKDRDDNDKIGIN